MTEAEQARKDARLAAEIRDALRGVKAALDRNSALLDRMLDDAADGDDDTPRCPQCGATDLENTSTMGAPRMTCLSCRQSFPCEVN